MARLWHSVLLLALVLLVLTPRIARAQLTDLPDLTTGNDAAPTPTDDADDDATTGDSSPSPTDADDSPTTTDASPSPTPTDDDDDDDDDNTTTDAPDTTEGPSTVGTTATSAQGGFTLTSAPPIPGVGIPALQVPWTGGAPFMQKSSLPEGTVFIAVGAVLAFIAASILLWHLLVAWSINRSVKRAAAASMASGSEKRRFASNPSGYKPHHGGGAHPAGIYKDDHPHHPSSLSLDALTSAGKKPHHYDSSADPAPSPSHHHHQPPTNLFFSPTTQAANRLSTYSTGAGGPISPLSPRDRASAFLPSGFYAQPNSSTTHHSVAARNSSYNPSPPPSPGLPPQARRRASRDAIGAAPARAPAVTRHSLYGGNSNSSLMMVGGTSTPDLGGGRVPSAYLDDLFENHGNGPRERF